LGNKLIFSVEHDMLIISVDGLNSKSNLMKINISIISFFAFIFVSSASFSQYKYDIGLRASSYDLERFQLDFRYHLDSPYSLVFSIGSGSDGSGNHTQSPVFNDSLLTINNRFQNASNTVFKFGVQRKLGFLASDVFYVGATIGLGFDQERYSNDLATYVVETDSMGNVKNPIDYPWGYQGSVYSASTFRAVNAQLALSAGMDVPLTKRFSINAEIGFAGIYRKILDNSFTSIITLYPSVSGGLRYSFGKQ